MGKNCQFYVLDLIRLCPQFRLSFKHMKKTMLSVGSNQDLTARDPSQARFKAKDLIKKNCLFLRFSSIFMTFLCSFCQHQGRVIKCLALKLQNLPQFITQLLYLEHEVFGQFVENGQFLVCSRPAGRQWQQNGYKTFMKLHLKSTSILKLSQNTKQERLDNTRFCCPVAL